MSTETNNTTEQPSQSLLIGLSMIGGAGITAIVVALGIGVVLPDVDTATVGILVLGGFLALIGSIVAWAGVTKPFSNFDDINVPIYHGHDHHDDHSDDDHGDDHADTDAH